MISKFFGKVSKATAVLSTSALLALGLVSVSATPANAAACVNAGAFGGGDGSAGDPFQVSTPAQLQYLARAIDSGAGLSGKKIVLTANIDLAGCGFSPNGSGVPFEGVFDGQGFSISNLSVSKPSTSYAGLFSTASLAEIKNLVLISPTIVALSYSGAVIGQGDGTDLTNISVVNASVTGASRVGGLVGQLENQTGQTMENLRVSGSTVTGQSGVGGVIGLLTWGDLSKVSFSEGRVIGASGVSPSQVGGLVGVFGSAAYPNQVSRGISLSSFTGSVEITHGSSTYAGLLLGSVRNSAATVTDSYARGAIKTGGATVSSGAAGLIDSSGYGSTLTLNRVYVQGSYYTLADPTVSVNANALASSVVSSADSFFDSAIHTMFSSTSGGTGKTSAELLNPATYPVSWTVTQDTDAVRAVSAPSDTWYMNDQVASGYPVHVWSFRLGVEAVECPVGRYSVTGLVPCVNASAGNYVGTTGATAEVQCLPGTFQSNVGAASCVPAQPGYFVATAGQSSETQCAAGTTSDAGATACFAISTSYQGPIVSSSPVVASVGEQVVFSGERLSQVSSVSISGKSASATCTATSCSFTVPEGVSAGLQDLVLLGSHGVLTIQDGIRVEQVVAAEETAVIGWTKKLDDNSAKIYAKNVVGAGKVQFMLNGEEIAWVRAASAADSKLRSANGAAYLVRTVEFAAGKNVLEVYVDGVRTTRTAYTK